MKICVFGVFSGDLDEGYKNIVYNLSRKLSQNNDILAVDAKTIFSFSTWKRIRDFDPDIIHYFTAPTFSSFIVLIIAKRWCKKDVKVVISALNPYCLKLLKMPFLTKVMPIFKTDIILTQCKKVTDIFEMMGFKTAFLPNGVDIGRFIPVSNERKIELRQKYGVNPESFVILHVGHLREKRGIKLFEKIQNEGGNIQVIIVGSSYFKTDQNLCKKLLDSGCLIWQRYFKNIEEIYALADCYVFPTPVGDSIFMPLSVLEAMSCNIPVISTKFEGLVDNFENGLDLMFFTDIEDLNRKLDYIKKGLMKTTCRNKIESWNNICYRLENIYSKLMVEVSKR